MSTVSSKEYMLTIDECENNLRKLGYSEEKIKILRDNIKVMINKILDQYLYESE